MEDLNPSDPNANVINWLARLLQETGISQSKLSEQIAEQLKREPDRSIINKVLKGRRELGIDELYAIVTITNRQPPMPKLEHQIPVVGYVEAGARVNLFELGQGPFDYVDGPSGAPPETVAVRVVGDSMHPITDGTLVFYCDRREPATDDLIGCLCVIGLADGNCVLKELYRGSQPDRWNLVSWNAPPMENCEVAWAAPVEWTKPAQRRRRQ